MTGKKSTILQLGSMTTQVAMKELESLTLRLFLSKTEREARYEDIQTQIAEIIFSKLSHLKGTGLKLLQGLSLDEGLLPAPYIKKFEQAYGKAAPLTRPVVKRVFRNELGSNPEEVFEHFDYQCLAAASLGQVHQATLPSGERVVVKIQYPNVAENVESDLKLVKTMTSMLNNPLIRSTVEEISNQLLEELDYEKELANLELFQNIASESGVAAPKPFPEFSSRKVLTLSELQGTPVHECDDSSATSKALGEVLKLFLHSLKNHRCIHADPHPGNFLVHPEVTGVVDFGSVKKQIPDQVVELFLQLLNPNANPETITSLYSELGAETGKDPDSFYSRYVEEFHLASSSLFDREQVDFSEARETVVKLRRILFVQSREKPLKNLSSEFTMLHKSLQSLLFMFCKYKVQADTLLP